MCWRRAWGCWLRLLANFLKPPPRLAAQLRQSGRPLLGLLGQLPGLVGLLLGKLPLLPLLLSFRLQLLEPREAAAIRPQDGQLFSGEVEANAQSGADEALELATAHQGLAAAQVDVQPIAVGVVEVVLLDAVLLGEGVLVDPLLPGVARREHREDNSERDVPLLPLLVRAAIPLGPAEDHEDVGGGAGVGPALHIIGLDAPSLAARKKPLTSLSPELAEVVRFAREQGARAIGVDVMVPADREQLPALQPA